MKIPGIERAVKTWKERRSLIVLVLAGVLGTGSWFAWQAQTPKPERKGGAPQTVAAATEDLRVRIRSSGTVTPTQSVNVSPKRAGRLVKLLVDQGNRVTEGQAIAQMENDDLAAQLAQAQANLQQAEAKLLEAKNGARSEDLAGGEAQIATAVANVADAQAKLDQAEDDRKRNQDLAKDGAISKNSLGAVNK